MSYNTNNNWVYRLYGRKIKLFEHRSGGATDVVAGYSVKLPDNYIGAELIYPDENITNGLRFEGTAAIEPFVTTDPNELSGGENPTLTEDTAPSESSYINLNPMLSLAVVDYVKAQMADRGGDLQQKEYYMREFWKKNGDNDSNKRKVAMSIPSSPYAVR